MKKWEYKNITYIRSRFDEIPLERINKLGQEGWRVINSYMCVEKIFVALMEREIPKPLEPPEITARRMAALNILHDETLSLDERVHRSLQAASGKTEPPTEDDSEHPSDYGGFD
jgi:hypothetical protein